MGPILIGYAYERLGGYHTAYLLITGASIIGITSLTAAGPVRALIDKR
jgi:hypothetical protein